MTIEADRPGSGQNEIILPAVREALAASAALIARSVQTLSAEDPGIFGPHSVSWRIFRSPAYSVSAVAGLLMEALHPVAMTAIDQHSDYRLDAWRRAQRTAEYVFTITFSSSTTALAASERVRAIHRQIVGTTVAGREYRAEDPDLLLWIHCVNTEMALRGHDAFGSALSAAEADQFVTEQVRAGCLVGIEEPMLPRTRADLLAYIGSMNLELTAPAREFAHLLMHARMPITMRLFWAVHIVGALGILPQEVRALYGFPLWLPTGALTRAGIRFVMMLVDAGYWAIGPVRKARHRLSVLSAQVSAAG